MLPSITFGKDALSRFGEVIEKEWLITNGLGGYSSSTVLGINTRKYHGLLIAALDPPGNRTVCVSKLDEDVILGDEVYRLGSNEFHDVIYPEGYKLITQFSLNSFPTYSYNVSSVHVNKTVFMPKNKNAVAVTYKITNNNGSDVKIRLYPLLTCRYFHNVVYRMRVPLNFALENTGTQFQATFQRPQAVILCRITEGEFEEKVNWLNHIHYRDELLRGEADVDDCFQPGYFEVQVPANGEKEFAVTIAVSHESQEAKEILDSIGKTFEEVNASLNRELNQQSNLLANFYHAHPKAPMSDWLNWILLAADSFMVENSAGKKAYEQMLAAQKEAAAIREKIKDRIDNEPNVKKAQAEITDALKDEQQAERAAGSARSAALKEQQQVAQAQKHLNDAKAADRRDDAQDKKKNSNKKK